MTSDLESQLLDLQAKAKAREDELAKAKTALAKLEAKQETLDDELREQFGLESWDQADELLSRLEAETKQALNVAKRLIEESE